MVFHNNKVSTERDDLASYYGLPVFCYMDYCRDQIVYRTRGGFAGEREIGRVNNTVTFSVKKFLDVEIALMVEKRPEDWSI